MAICSIKILPSEEIDKSKWDDCVRRNENGFLFAKTPYLDCMAKHWDGLVVGDYDGIVPLIWNKKWGIKYLYQLPFVIQLGLIGNCKSLMSIIDVLSKYCRYGYVYFNYKNTDVDRQLMIGRRNYVLNLNRDYSLIYADYKKSLKQKLRKISALTMMNANFNEVISVYRKHFIRKYKDVPDEFRRMQILGETDFGKQYFHPYKVVDEDGNTLLFGIYIKDGRRIYKFMTTHVNDGQKKYAMIFALDFLIKKYAGQPLLYDFMGSELPGVRTFLQNFSPQEQLYFVYHFNFLPPLIQLLKK